MVQDERTSNSRTSWWNETLVDRGGRDDNASVHEESTTRSNKRRWTERASERYPSLTSIRMAQAHVEPKQACDHPLDDVETGMSKHRKPGGKGDEADGPRRCRASTTNLETRRNNEHAHARSSRTWWSDRSKKRETIPTTARIHAMDGLQPTRTRPGWTTGV